MASKTTVPASMVALALVLTASAQAQPADPLTQAYNALKRGDYVNAINFSHQYLAANPHEYDADFIHAAGECGLHPGNAAALAEMIAVRDGYDLTPTPAAADQVATWITRCQQAPLKVASSSSTGDVGSSVSALTAPPGPAPATSAAPGGAQPRPRIHMSGFIPATSYSGDDYNHVAGPTAAQCAQLCMLQAPCRSVTYDTSAKICWLKRSVPPAQHGQNFVSATKVIPPPANPPAVQR